MATGIPPKVWAEEGEQAIVTALELLNEQHGRSNGPQGQRMSG